MIDLLGVLWGPLGGVLAALAGALGLWVKTRLDVRKARNEGRTKAEELARRLDHENAADIRNRARDARSRVRKDGDARGYRD